jgi:DNA-binding transcriptional MerR regulator
LYGKDAGNFEGGLEEGMTSDTTVWRVGEIAKLTGLSVRTLHYYEEMGLLEPADRTETGHRRYTEADIARLQQILSLKSIGFSLEEIRECLKNPNYSPLTVLKLHMEQVRRQIDALMQLQKRLETVADQLQQRGAANTQEFIYLMEGIRMAEKYPFTPEQMEKIRQQGEKLGPDKIREVEQEWPELIAKVRAEMEKGTPPDSPEVRQLARRWKELVEMFTGGDQGIAETLKRRYMDEPGYAAQFGMSRELLEYVGKAME